MARERYAFEKVDDFAPQAATLERSFRRAARRVRARLGLRRVLTGAALGLVAGGVAAGLAWWLRQGELRPLAAGLGLVGALLGGVLAARRRLSDEDVALYLDQRLGKREELVTALGLRHEQSEAALHLQARAARTLAAERLPAPRVLDAPQLLGPFGAGAVVWLSLLPLPPAPPTVRAPGVERLSAREVKGLERIEALSHQRGRSPEDERRLRALADEAKKLRGELASGMEKREALARMARLRDSIAQLRSDLSNQENRAGLEAAIGALSEHPELRKAARALGDGDVTAFDREMQRLANLAEQKSREEARQALEAAERAAREKGAKNLADALKQEREAFAGRQADAEALRELGQALRGKLDPDALEDLKEFGGTGDPEAARRLAQAMGKALSKLSPEERKRLAEQLGKQLEQTPGGGSPMTREEMQELARRLASPEGEHELEEHLRQLANPQRSDEAQRDGALDDAERGLGEAERGLGMTPMPLSGGPEGGPQSPGPSGKDPSANKAGGGPGSHHDSGSGEHSGESQEVTAPELRSKAHVTRSGVGPLHEAGLGRAPARPGDTANQRGTGSLGSVVVGEIGAIEQSEVPEEYREHVGRYFEP